METVGEILRSTREKKGLTVKDVEKATSIRSLYIIAIEEENFSVIPGEVYLKGFIRNYANFLGLDGQAMVNLYRETQAQNAPEQIEPQQTPQPNETSRYSAKWLVVGVIAAALLAGGGWWLLSAKNANNPPPEVKQAPAAPVQPSPTPQPTPSVQTPVNPQSPPQTKPVVVNAKFTDACWTLVTADGKEVFEGIAKAGDTYTWEADKTLTVKLGNAGAAELTVNGQALGVQGGKGEVIVKTFSANTMKKP